MPISTLKPQRSFALTTIIIYTLALLGVGLLVYFSGNLIQNLINLKSKSGLTVNVKYGSAEVDLNTTLLGTAPLEYEKVKPGENKVSIKSDVRQYEASYNFIPNWHVVIVRDLGVSDVFSSGQDTWMEENNSGSVLSVISEPVGASVFIDNTEIGKTPFSSNKLTEGSYDMKISYPGYEDEAGRIKIVKDHKLNISANLFPMPVPSQVNLMEGSQSLYNISTDNPLVYADPQTWVKAIIYWNQTRGINLANAGMNKDLVFDYYLDYKGNLYAKDGTLFTDPRQYSALKDVKKGVYLGRIADGPGLSLPAKKTYETVFTLLPGGKIVAIKQTGTGWLRVRDLPSLDGKEIAKVNTGEQYAVLEERTGWIRIKVSDTITGWISSDYVQEVKK